MGGLKVSLSYISEECIVKTLEQAQETERLLKHEISCRCDNDGIPTTYEFDGDCARQDPSKMQRDSFIRKNESNNRMKLNQTMDLTAEKLKINDELSEIQRFGTVQQFDHDMLSPIKQNYSSQNIKPEIDFNYVRGPSNTNLGPYVEQDQLYLNASQMPMGPGVSDQERMRQQMQL